MLFLKIETYPSEKLTVKIFSLFAQEFCACCRSEAPTPAYVLKQNWSTIEFKSNFFLKLCILTGSNNLNCYTFTSLLWKI